MATCAPLPRSFRCNFVIETGTQIARVVVIVNIRFTSSLTAEDENLLAPAVLAALTSILDLLPIAYMIRIDTSDSQVYQHSGTRRTTQTVVEAGGRRMSVPVASDS
jgi:hypothetical protein